MLAGFLTTALEIVIILDVCGVVAYFVISGLARLRKPRQEGDVRSPSPHLQPCAVEGPALSTAPYFGAVANPGLDIYAGPSPALEGGNEGFSVTSFADSNNFASTPSEFMLRTVLFMPTLFSTANIFITA